MKQPSDHSDDRVDKDVVHKASLLSNCRVIWTTKPQNRTFGNKEVSGFLSCKFSPRIRISSLTSVLIRMFIGAVTSYRSDVTVREISINIR